MPDYQRLETSVEEYELGTSTRNDGREADLQRLENHNTSSPALRDPPDSRSEQQLSNTLPFKILRWLHSIFGRPYDAFLAWKRRSRFHGWQWGVFTGACTSTIVLLLNIVFLIIGSSVGSDNESGIITLYTGSATDVSRANILFHLLINVLSTCLLGASNYSMQVLSAPTLKECIQAHRQGTWAQVGVSSVRNMRIIKGRRRFIWVILGLSSIPLHLFYNASVFPVISGNDHSVRIMPNSSRHNAFDDSIVSEVPVSTLSAIYGADYVSGYGNVTLYVGAVRLRWTTDDFQRMTRNSSNIPAPSLHLPQETQYYGGKGNVTIWRALDQDGWVRADLLYDLPDLVWKNESGASSMPTMLLNVEAAFARKDIRNSRIQLSLPFTVVVIASNTIKTACFLLILYYQRKGEEDPLVTVGDAVTAFMERPDEATQHHCAYSKEEFDWKMGLLKRSKPRELDGRAAELDRRCQGIWEQTRPQYGSAISVWKRVVLIIAGFAIPMSLAPVFMGSIPLGGWGSASPIRIFQTQLNFDGNTTSQLAFTANSPQLLISLIDLYFNSMFTSMALAREYDQLGVSRKGLRVSKPRGLQRETYFLQLPFKWGIPLNALSGLLHWLTSQTIFLARFDRIGLDGKLKIDESEAGCGFSSSALVALMLVLVALGVLVVSFGLLSHEAHIPPAGSCSWVISAACHPDPNEVDPALREVMWGVLPQFATGDPEVKHCSFSANEVEKLVEGKKYR